MRLLPNALSRQDVAPDMCPELHVQRIAVNSLVQFLRVEMKVRALRF